MSAPVRCWLVYRGARIDRYGFVTTVDSGDYAAATAHLRRHLAGAIRGEGADPAAHGSDYSLDVARTDQPDPLITTVRLT